MVPRAGYFENEEGGTPQLFWPRDLSGPSLETTSDIWVSELQPDGTFGNAQLVAELSSPQADQRPSIRFDGLEIFFILQPRCLDARLLRACRPPTSMSRRETA